jgi:hypothetical protein
MTAYHKENAVTETPIVDEIEARLQAERELDEELARRSAYDISPAAAPDDEELDHAHDEADVAPNAITAFLVVVGPDGGAFATSELTKITEVLPQREATVQDMRRACQDVVFDVNAMQTAQQTVAVMQQQAQAMADQARNAKIAAKLQSKGIHVPGRH